MELNELQNIWMQYDRKISENTRLNKEILKRMLISKSERKFSKVILTACIEVIVTIILVVYFLAKHLSFQPQIEFFIGLIVFVAAIGIPVIGHIRYILILYRMNFSESVLSLRKKINESEKIKEKNIRYGRLMVPFILLSVLFVSTDIKNITMLHFSKIIDEPIFFAFAALISVILSLFFILSIKHFKDKTLNEIDHELSEIEELEKE
jgi:hypothetical protein